MIPVMISFDCPHSLIFMIAWPDFVNDPGVDGFGECHFVKNIVVAEYCCNNQLVAGPALPSTSWSPISVHLNRKVRKNPTYQILLS